MNSLEFIENIIKNLKEILKGIDNRIQEDQNYPTLLAHHIGEKEHFEKELAHFQQIKAEIEAWEICKNKSVDIHDVIHCSSLEVFNCGLYEKYQLTEEEYNKIKKALEVKDNDN